MKTSLFAVALTSIAGLTACAPPPASRVQGYVEGEFVYVASPLPGALKTIAVGRGDTVKAGDPLFTLDRSPEMDALEQARHRLGEARANLADARKGRRSSEIHSLEAQISQARAALDYSAAELARQEKLSLVPGAGSTNDLEKARASRGEDAAHLAQMEADLDTGRLGARDDAVAALEANVHALEAAQARSQWEMEQKSQAAPQAGLVFDTLYRPGEWVEAGRPVVALLPPQNIKVRAFVSESVVGALHPGDPLIVHVDGATNAFTGRISFISPQAEYTPPVIYSNENRAKLAFMIEAIFDPDTAVLLHPGQPVDVQLHL
ncbi:Multidrug resistance efflux pump [Verrucomicrobia bacterium]|nr:Multidrug resistance efflux pump [Verrucomicrobiota bacterium]